MLALLMTVTLLLVSLHHLSCFNDDIGNRGPAAISALGDHIGAPAKSEPCLPGHCHCVCHISGQRMGDAVLRLADFSNYRYRLLAAEDLHSLTGLPPFKPPRA
jgi:hypothetical protein